MDETLAVNIRLETADRVDEADGFTNDDIDGFPVAFRVERVAV